MPQCALHCHARLVLKVLVLLGVLEFLSLLVPHIWPHAGRWPPMNRGAFSASEHEASDPQISNPNAALSPDSPFAHLQSALDSAADEFRVKQHPSSNNSRLELSFNSSKSDTGVGKGDGTQSGSFWPEWINLDPCAAGNCTLPLCTRDDRYGMTILFYLEFNCFLVLFRVLLFQSKLQMYNCKLRIATRY